MPDTPSSDMKSQLDAYRELVERYESIDKEIDALIMRNGGASKNMSNSERDRYQDLATLRRELQNEMRIMEQDLFDDE